MEQEKLVERPLRKENGQLGEGRESRIWKEKRAKCISENEPTGPGDRLNEEGSK